MKKKQHPSHDEFVVRRLKKDPEMAAELLKVAIEEIEEEGGDYVLHKALHMIAKAQGIGKIARKAGIPPESLSRLLSSRGNPRLSTLLTVTRAMGLHLTLKT